MAMKRGHFLGLSSTTDPRYFAFSNTQRVRPLSLPAFTVELIRRRLIRILFAANIGKILFYLSRELQCLFFVKLVFPRTTNAMPEY